MRSLSAALLAHLQGNVRTITNCALITRSDGLQLGCTDLDVDVVFQGVRFIAGAGVTASAIEWTGDLSTSNLEIDGLILPDGSGITQSDIEGGLWSNATVALFIVNYNDLTMGKLDIFGGNFGNFTTQNGKWKVELRGLTQAMQQPIGEQFSSGCPAKFGDSRCQISLADKTFSGSVQAVTTPGLAWTDGTLTQTAPAVPYTDTNGHTVPTISPYQVQIVPPSGSYQSNIDVRDPTTATLSQVTGAPGDRQYQVSAGGLYTFNSNQAGNFFYIDYLYAIGYFTYGVVKWITGANAGLSMEVKSFSPGSVTLGMPMPHPIAVGDTYTITAGCDKQFGTCRDRWHNIIHFRGQPYIPGPDAILRPQGS